MPVLDTVVVVSAVGGSVERAAADKPANLLALAMTTAVWGASAWYGYSNVSDCRRQLGHDLPRVPVPSP